MGYYNIVCDGSVRNKSRLILCNYVLQDWLEAFGEQLGDDFVEHCAEGDRSILSYLFRALNLWNQPYMS